MSSFAEKPMSLVEKKKQQWAQERDELATLCVPWGNSDRPKLNSRSRSKRLSIENLENVQKHRRSSLPPLYKNQNHNSVEKLERDMGGETSGYGSDNPNHTPEYFQQQWNYQAGYESSTSCRDDRLKWGDRGVGVGKFWGANEMSEYEKKLISDTPGWVKRGLQRETELIVSNSSPAESPEQCYVEDRPCTGSSISQNKTYIRGQNVFIDPRELAERERRRQQALAHQEAIKQQLEERERKKREERENRIREEREEELRIEREQELELKRRELEMKKLQEKKEKERKRKEALQEALELAEKEAKARKELTLRKNINENVKEKDKILASPIHENIKNNESTAANNEKTDNNSCKLKNAESFVNNNLVSQGIEEEDEELEVEIDIGNENDNHLNQNNNFVISTPNIQMPTTFQDNLAVVLQTPIETLQTMQFAVLMPTLGSSMSQTVPIAVPLTVATPRTENRVLTPTLYRNSKNVCDSSTQTDFLNEVDTNFIREKMANVDLNFESRGRKSNRARSEDRNREMLDVRPKWNANRPPTRYLKQSEKDPLYQRRKMRQKMRQVKMYDDKINNEYSPHSSDDSQATSPVYYRKKGYSEKRSGRAMWRKNEQLFSRNVSVYQTEIVPIESDKNQIYYKPVCQCTCEGRKHTDVKIVDIFKQQTSPREVYVYKTARKCSSECGNHEHEVLQDLNTLRTNLLEKQDLNSPNNTPRRHI